MDHGCFELVEIGRVENDHTDEIPKDYRERLSHIKIHDEYSDALLGIEEHSHIVVVAWFHRSERDVKQVFPMKNKENPLTGVFATRSPVRPNPIAITVCKLVKREGNLLTVKGLDFFHGTPVIDIKSYSKHMIAEDPTYPDWVPR